MKNFLKLQILFFLIPFSSCNSPWCKISFSDRVRIYYTNQMSEESGAMYEYAPRPPKAQDYLLQLTDVTPFEWDTLVWVTDSLKSEDISKIIGTQYADKNTYKGKRKLIFMDGGKVADIYALKEQDKFYLITGDVQNGYAKISRDTWFTVHMNNGSFILNRFGVSNIHISQDLSANPLKRAPRFKLDFEGYDYSLSSDTAESKRKCTLANVDFKLSPLARQIGKRILTKEQLAYIQQNKIYITVIFSVYLDTGDISDCFWRIDDGNKDFVSDLQWEQLSEIVLNMRIDPRRIYQPYPWVKYPAGKRLYTNWTMDIASSLRD